MPTRLPPSMTSNEPTLPSTIFVIASRTVADPSMPSTSLPFVSRMSDTRPIVESNPSRRYLRAQVDFAGDGRPLGPAAPQCTSFACYRDLLDPTVPARAFPHSFALHRRHGIVRAYGGTRLDLDVTVHVDLEVPPPRPRQLREPARAPPREPPSARARRRPALGRGRQHAARGGGARRRDQRPRCGRSRQQAAAPADRRLRRPLAARVPRRLVRGSGAHVPAPGRTARDGDAPRHLEPRAPPSPGHERDGARRALLLR